MTANPTGHDDNAFTEELIDNAIDALNEGAPDTVEDYARIVVASTLRTLADGVKAAEEDDMLWPDSDDLLILAGQIEDGDE